jgi:DNA-binding transcriptional regulator of glucitol operon
VKGEGMQKRGLFRLLAMLAVIGSVAQRVVGGQDGHRYHDVTGRLGGRDGFAFDWRRAHLRRLRGHRGIRP